MEYVGVKPTRGSEFAAAYDLYCSEDIEISPLLVTKVKTGTRVKVPDGHVGLIRDRSGLGSKGVFVAAGVIDPDYTGELLVCMWSFNFYPFKAGDRVAQMLVLPTYTGKLIEVTEFEQTKRGESGFGSTGC